MRDELFKKEFIRYDQKSRPSLPPVPKRRGRRPGSGAVPRPPRRMSLRDAGFLLLERPQALLQIGCIAMLDREVSQDELVRRIDAQIPDTPRYAQRVLEVPLDLAYPTWEDDPAFDVRNHVRRWAVPRPAGTAELHETIAQIWVQPLDRSRPLWEMHLLEGLEGGRTAIFQKVHHSMIDGVAGVQLLENLLDATPRPEPASRAARDPEPLPGPAEQLRRGVSDEVSSAATGLLRTVRALPRPSTARLAARVLRELADAVARVTFGEDTPLPWNAAISSQRRLAFTRLPLEDVRRIRAAHGGTVNDVVLAVLAGGVRHYLDACGLRVPTSSPDALVPVSLRSSEEADTLGNRISAMRVPLPIGPSDERARLAATRTTTARLKERRSWQGIDGLLTTLERMPPAILGTVARRIPTTRIANLIATNVRGPRDSRHFGSARVEALYPLVPIVDGIGLGLAVFSYAESLHVGINADPGLVPDLSELRRGIEESFSRLAATS